MVTPVASAQAFAKVHNVKALVQMLQAIKSTAKQVNHFCTHGTLQSFHNQVGSVCTPTRNALQHCTVLMGTEGLSVRWEIDSKTLQSSIFLRPEVSFCRTQSGNLAAFALCWWW